MTFTPIADAMRCKLQAAFAPTHLRLEDQSHQHAGHGGMTEHARDHGAGESHFHLTIASDVFRDMTRLQRHQAIMAVLADEMPRIHALSIDVRVD